MIEQWQGALGADYLERDPPRIDERRTVFRSLGVYLPGTAREVGCSAGYNLHALQPEQAIGIEPNPAARRAAVESGLVVLDGDVTELPFEDEQFDLVLSAGLLIHVPPGQVGKAIRELVRVTRSELLLLEYDGDGESIPYRDVDPGIWKRDYGALVLEHAAGTFPSLTVARDYEFVGTPFEGCTGWLFRRS